MLESVNNIESAVNVYFDRDHEGLQTVVLTLFAGFNFARVIAYVPQIVKAARDSNGASAISYTTWGLFSASNLMTFLYAIVCLGDLLMAAIFLCNTLSCIAIIVVALRNRLRFAAAIYRVSDDPTSDNGVPRRGWLPRRGAAPDRAVSEDRT